MRALPFMRLFERCDDCRVEIAPLRKLKAWLRDFIRQFWRGGQDGLVHRLVVAVGVIVALDIKRLDFAADGEGEFVSLPSPGHWPSLAQLDGN